MRIRVTGSSSEHKKYKRDMKKPLCPHCYNGEIVYKELHEIFLCMFCGNRSFLATEKGREVKVIQSS